MPESIKRAHRHAGAGSLPCVLALVACASHPASSLDIDARAADAAHDANDANDAKAEASDATHEAGADVNKASACASTFGDALTNAFGRFDGTVIAVVPPADDACAGINGTHLVLQARMEGAVYRMVLDVLSDSGDPNVFFFEENAPLAAGPWTEGWHAGVRFDYVNTLQLHSTQFAALTETALVDKVTSEIQIGSHVSVFATSAGESDSAHLIHRNVTNQDGAIVLNPEAASPHYLLFRFAEDVF